MEVEAKGDKVSGERELADIEWVIFDLVCVGEESSNGLGKREIRERKVVIGLERLWMALRMSMSKERSGDAGTRQCVQLRIIGEDEWKGEVMI
jgi:hypothetical protein